MEATLVACMGVGAHEELDVLDAADEALDAVPRICEEGLSRDDQLPAAIPSAAADETAVGELCRDGAVEERGVANSPERLMFAREEERLAERGAAGPSGILAKPAAADVKGQRHGMIHHEPVAHRGGRTIERWGAHGVGAAWNEIHIRRGGEGIGRVMRWCAGHAGAAIRKRIHAEVALEGDAYRVDFRAEAGAGEGAVPCAQLPAKEVQAGFDIVGEADDETGLGKALSCHAMWSSTLPSSL